MKVFSEFFIAARYLWGKGRGGGRYLKGAAIGIALSLVPIMVTLIVADGMIQGITDRYLELGTGHIQVYDYFSSNAGEFPALPELPGLRGAWKERSGLAVIMGSGGKAGAAVRATETSFWTDAGSRRFLKVIEGSAELEGANEVLLGEELARSVGAETGKTVYIMSVHANTSAASGASIPRTLPFKVKGIISSGYRELDALWCVLSYSGGERLLDPAFSQDYLMLKIDDPYRKADATASILAAELGAPYSVYTWKDLQRSQYSSYESTRQLLLFIMALIVLVAAVNVSSATGMLVIDRRQDIAVLKAAGASPAATSRIFLCAGFFTGLGGVIAGSASGLLIGYFINQLIRGLEAALSFFTSLFHGGEVRILDSGYYLEVIPIIINWKTVAFIGLFTLLCSVLASWFPARRAGKIPPIEILRKI
ncbi:MAG: ABC transporter permease [Spirochaetaceae bacterium]|nr:ABC transporter permease [Spirochaetaceae bacterium]